MVEILSEAYILRGLVCNKTDLYAYCLGIRLRYDLLKDMIGWIYTTVDSCFISLLLGVEFGVYCTRKSTLARKFSLVL